MRLVRYNIRLLEPLLIKSDSGDPNVAMSSGYIPGSVIRGALIDCWRKKGNFQVSDREVRRLFFGEATCFLNGYPIEPDYGRCLPAPLSLRASKNSQRGREVHDIATTDQAESEDAVPLPPSFVTFPNEEHVIVSYSKRSVNIHIDRPKSGGSPDKSDGAVFQIECLKEGQTFQAIILAEQDQDLQNLVGALPGIVQIGSSKGGGYGRVEIQTDDLRIEDSSGNVESQQMDLDSDVLILTLSSHAIFRNSDGITARSKDEVQSFLSDEIGERIEICRAFSRVEITGGFNRKWRLPLPQEYALAAGSVFVINAPTSSVRASLENLSLIGLGERCNEGFGRFCINLHGHSQYKVLDPVQNEHITKISISKSSPAYANAQFIVNRLAKDQWQRRVREHVREIVISSFPFVNRSQINGLRNIVEDLISKQSSAHHSAQRLREHLRSMTDRERLQIERVKVEYKSLPDWLEARCREMEALNSSDNNNITAGFETAVELGGIKPSVSGGVMHEFQLKLLHGVLMRIGQLKDKETCDAT